MANEITMYRGKKKDIIITVTENSSAKDLTDYTMTFYLMDKQSMDVSEAVLSKEATYDDPTTGIGTISLTESDTEISQGDYYYFVRIDDDSGDDLIVVDLTPATVRLRKKFMSVEEFKGETGITEMEDHLIDDALIYAKSQILVDFFRKITYRTKSSDTIHYLISETFSRDYLPFVADADGNGKIDEDDLTVFELDSELNETDKTANISSFNSKYGKLTLDTSLPTSGNELRVEYYIMKLSYDILEPILKKVSKMYAINWLFENVPYEKLQQGISRWTLNGVSIEFDKEAITKVIEDNSKKITKLKAKYKPLHIRTTRMQKDMIGGSNLLKRNNISFS